MLKPNTFCVLPWTHLATHPQGMLSLCCRVIYDDGIGMSHDCNENSSRYFHQLSRDSIVSAFNSDSFRQARREMLAGQRPAACRQCFELEDCGLPSKRQAENKNFPEDRAEMVKKTAADGSINPDFRFVELRLGNLCNLRCRTCNPASSTSWKKDYEKLEASLDFVRSYKYMEDFSWPERAEFWEELERHSASLELLYINGGEPTLIRRHWDFLRRLIETRRASQITLWYNSNLMHLPEIAFPLWREFREVKISASIDDIGMRNHYIRHPADWAVIERHLEKIRNAGFFLSLTQTVSAMNFYYLPDLARWANGRGLWLDHNFVEDPHFLGPHALPQEIRLAAIKRVRAHVREDQIQVLERVYSGPSNQELWRKFCAYTSSLDLIRGESFREVFPELVDHLLTLGYSWEGWHAS